MNNIESNTGEIVMYQPDETIRLEVRVENETVWLTQQQISDLFLRDRTVINRHINNDFKEGECDKESNVHFLHIPNSDKPLMYYRVYIFGTSLKDAGKKLFAYIKMQETPAAELLNNVR